MRVVGFETIENPRTTSVMRKPTDTLNILCLDSSEIFKGTERQNIANAIGVKCDVAP